jgi:four helix bundle suffix protein
MTSNNDFIPQKGNYRKLIVFKISECVYDITYYFAHKFFSKSDRTIDQMVQAARSGKQNIAEGSSAATTSKETEIKLTNVAKASLQELLLDYEDYLRVNNLQLWDKEDEKAIRTRRICTAHNDSAFYREAIASRSPETIANIAIILIHQADVMLAKLIERQKAEFLKSGGVKEEMSRGRINYRNAKQ